MYVMKEHGKLSVAGMIFTETMLIRIEEINRIQKFGNVRIQYMLHNFRTNTSNRDRTVIIRGEAISFFKDWYDLTYAPVIGNRSCVERLLENK